MGFYGEPQARGPRGFAAQTASSLGPPQSATLPLRAENYGGPPQSYGPTQRGTGVVPQALMHRAAGMRYGSTDEESNQQGDGDDQGEGEGERESEDGHGDGVSYGGPASGMHLYGPSNAWEPRNVGHEDGATQRKFDQAEEEQADGYAAISFQAGHLRRRGGGSGRRALVVRSRGASGASLRQWADPRAQSFPAFVEAPTAVPRVAAASYDGGRRVRFASPIDDRGQQQPSAVETRRRANPPLDPFGGRPGRLGSDLLVSAPRRRALSGWLPGQPLPPLPADELLFGGGNMNDLEALGVAAVDPPGLVRSSDHARLAQIRTTPAPPLAHTSGHLPEPMSFPGATPHDFPPVSSPLHGGQTAYGATSSQESIAASQTRQQQQQVDPAHASASATAASTVTSTSATSSGASAVGSTGGTGSGASASAAAGATAESAESVRLKALEDSMAAQAQLLRSLLAKLESNSAAAAAASQAKEAKAAEEKHAQGKGGAAAAALAAGLGERAATRVLADMCETAASRAAISAQHQGAHSAAAADAGRSQVKAHTMLDSIARTMLESVEGMQKAPERALIHHAVSAFRQQLDELHRAELQQLAASGGVPSRNGGLAGLGVGPEDDPNSVPPHLLPDAAQAQINEIITHQREAYLCEREWRSNRAEYIASQKSNALIVADIVQACSNLASPYLNGIGFSNLPAAIEQVLNEPSVKRQMERSFAMNEDEYVSDPNAFVRNRYCFTSRIRMCSARVPMS
jgi:hypothetical protein